MNTCCVEGSAGNPLLQGIPQGSVSHVPSTPTADEKLLMSKPEARLDPVDVLINLHGPCYLGFSVLFTAIRRSAWARHCWFECRGCLFG